ncbi:ZnF GATA [Geosmithia morbida]|uniref:ZnF GATA n=1 Tax=Geosmithia morbida TaxID=1094350 RepID=A0A9P4YT63_9HYPO|nr:ZnF GATA [Geosmithia morbida]KAF4122661.1 ZnF GATA [Geosmithia morbida]
METADPGARQSGPSANIHDRLPPPPLHHHHHPRPSDHEPIARRPQLSHPSMATATLLHPSSGYPSPANPYPSGPSGYPPPTSMISSVDPRRPLSEESDPSKRQSLPSISEVISNTKSTQYANPPPPPPPPPAIQPPSNYSSPFPTSLRSYAEADKQPQHPSPQSSHPPPSFPPAPPPQREHLPSFTDSPRSSFNGRHSLPAVADRRSSPSVKSEYPPHPYAGEPQRDHRPVNGGPSPYPPPPPQQQHPHPHPHPQQQQHQHPPPPPTSAPQAPTPYHTASLPHGQMPLPQYPASPRHGGPPHSYASPYEQRSSVSHPEEAERAAPRPPYEHSVYTTPWNYGESLGRVRTPPSRPPVADVERSSSSTDIEPSQLAQSSHTLFTFAEAYARLAQEQHGAHPIPERLPTEQEVNDMLSNSDMIRTALERVKEVVQQSIRNERAREQPPMKLPYEEQDMTMYEVGKPSCPDPKKRRGRAAPPGRCHSCNRVDTPEWRRGPDGARTLCNACGLHYAKLERKRNIRPKPDDRV